MQVLDFSCAQFDMAESLATRLDRYLASKGLGRKDGTKKFYREIVATIRKHLPDLHRPAVSLSEDDLTQFATKVASMCPSRWNAIVSAIRQITGRPKVLKYRKLRFRDFTPPNQQQFDALLAECDKMPRSHAGLIVRLLAVTGLRIAEARALEWDDVLEDRIHVSGGISKNGKPRSIPLLPGAKEVLERLRAIKTSDKVLPTPHFRRALEKACDRVGIPRLSYHCLRHIFLTRAIESGVDICTVSRWAGHSDGGSLLSRMYFHLLDDHSRRMAERVRILAMPALALIGV